MKQRVITAIFFAAAMLGGIFWGGHSFLLIFTLITIGCAWELTGMLFQEHRFRTLRRVWGTVAGILPFWLVAAGLSHIFILPIWVTAFIASLMAFGMFVAMAVELFLGAERPFANIGNFLLCSIYIGLPFAMLADIAIEFDMPYKPLRVFGLLLLIWTNDTMAYFVGSQLGRRKLFERISPNKTWEGTIGGGIFTVLVAWGLSFIIKDFTQTQWLVLGVVAAIFGTLGDLVESMLKRSVGVKDSGNLLPGHGGLLDRFDAFIFALPFFWLALQIFKN